MIKMGFFRTGLGLGLLCVVAGGCQLYVKYLALIPDDEGGWVGSRYGDFEPKNQWVRWLQPGVKRRGGFVRPGGGMVRVSAIELDRYSRYSQVGVDPVIPGINIHVGPITDGNIFLDTDKIRLVEPCDSSVLAAASDDKAYEVKARFGSVVPEGQSVSPARFDRFSGAQIVPVPKGGGIVVPGNQVNFKIVPGVEFQSADQCTLDLSDAIVLPVGGPLTPITFRRTYYRD